MFAGKKSAQIREILISESAWEEMTCLFAPSLEVLANAYCEKYFTDEDNERQEMYLAETIRDYAIKSCNELKNIESKLS